MLKLKVGDNVRITAGKDKGREGKIEKVFASNGTVLVPGINIYKRHLKAQNLQKGQKSGTYDFPRPLAWAKVALICPKCKKPTRVGFRMVEANRVRVCKKCQKEIDTK